MSTENEIQPELKPFFFSREGVTIQASSMEEAKEELAARMAPTFHVAPIAPEEGDQSNE